MGKFRLNSIQFSLIASAIFIPLVFQNCSQKSAFEVSQSVGEVFGVMVGFGNAKINSAALGQYVVVEDEGFDFTHEVFDNKIVAKYEVSCDADSKVVYSFDLSLSKEEILNRLQAPRNEGCRLKTVSSYPKANAYFPAAQLPAWNQAILKKSVGSSPYYEEFTDYYYTFINSNGVNNLNNGGAGYHATFVTGLLAYNNPSTKIITIDKNLKQFNRHDSLGAFNNSSCAVILENYQKMINFLSDADIKNAFINQPTGELEQGYIDLYNQYNVTVHNKSFSSPSAMYEVAEMILSLSSCLGGASANGYSYNSNLDAYDNILNMTKVYNTWGADAKAAVNLIRQYNLIRAQIENERYKKVYGSLVNKVVQVRAAGNDEQNLAQQGDSEFCYPLPNEIIIGSLNYQRQLSDFTNYGDCIDFYMLGDLTISTLPYGVLYAASGTSFSAPLTTRLFTLTIDPKLSFAEKKIQLLSYADQAGMVTKSYMLSNLSYDNKSESSGAFAKLSNPTENSDIIDRVDDLRSARLMRARHFLEMQSIFSK